MKLHVQPFNTYMIGLKVDAENQKEEKKKEVPVWERPWKGEKGYKEVNENE